MPLVSFLGLLACVIAGAGLSLVLAVKMGVPLAFLGLSAMILTAVLGFRQWS